MNSPGLKASEVKKLPFECQCCTANRMCYLGDDPMCMNFSKTIKEELRNENKV